MLKSSMPHSFLKSLEQFLGQSASKLFLLLLIAALPVTVFFAMERQEIRQRAESSCQTPNNLIANCDMSQGSGQLPDNFFNAATDPKRAAGPGQYTNDLKTVTIDGGRAIELGREDGTCSLPKTGAGGENDKLRLFPEARTYGYVGNANNFHLSFEFKMKSKHTRKISSPFYTWVGFARNPDEGRDDQGKGREALVAFTPHDDGVQDQYCNGPFRDDYVCWVGLYNLSRDQNVNCDSVDTEWRKIDVDFTRDSICQDGAGKVDPECVKKNKEVFIGFGVGNDYDTVVYIRNVSLTADRVNPPPNQSPTNPPNKPPDGNQPPTNPLITPNPLDPECEGLEWDEGSSLFKNAMFDEGFNDGVPDDWTFFGDANISDERGGEKWGVAGIKISGSGDFKAGVYQTVNGLTPNTWYHAFYATAQQTWGANGQKDGSLPILREVGVDLSGGTNPNSPNIIWGRTAGGQRDKDLVKYGGWKTLGNQNNPLVSFKTTGSSATIFLRASGWPDVSRYDTWIDSAFLVPSCEPDFVERKATPTPLPPAKRTGTPVPTKVGTNATCEVLISKKDESNSEYNVVTVNYSGFGGTVELNMSQKGTPVATENPFETRGFFSDNSFKGFTPADNRALENLNPNALGENGPFLSSFITVNNEPTAFKIFEWDKKFRNSPDSLDLTTGKEDAWWYLLDSCNGVGTACTKDNINVKIPKNESAWFYCSVKTQKNGTVCTGNPICDYNEGPDISQGRTDACNIWRQSCYYADYINYEQAPVAAISPPSTSNSSTNVGWILILLGVLGLLLL